MRILSPPRRTAITGATFSRNSEAYDSLGRIALPGLPRLEYVAGVGWVTWVEEVTANLIGTDYQKFGGWIASDGTIVTLTQNQAVTEWDCSDATRIQTSGGTGTIKYYYNLVLPSASGQAYSETVYIKNIGTITVKVQSNLGNSIDVLAGEIKKITLSDVGDGTNNLRLQFRTNTISDSLDFIAWHPMAEAKAYPTSFIPTSRAAESLTMPTTGLSVSEGTIEGIVEITDVSKRQDGSTFFRLFNIINGTGAGISIYHLATSAYWQLKTYTSNVVTSTVDIADSLTPNGFYYYKVSWTTSEAVAEFWNLESQTKVATGTISSPNLPTAFGSYVYLGSYNGSINYLDTRFGKHRLSSIARTDDPDFDNLMPNDVNTVGIFDPTPVYNHPIA